MTSSEFSTRYKREVAFWFHGTPDEWLTPLTEGAPTVTIEAGPGFVGAEEPIEIGRIDRSPAYPTPHPDVGSDKPSYSGAVLPFAAPVFFAVDGRSTPPAPAG